MPAQTVGRRQLPLLPDQPPGASPASAPSAFPALAERATTRYLAYEPREILNSPGATHMGFWSINPYVGCEFGCSYCYARDTHRWAIQRARDAGRLDTDPAWSGLTPAQLFEQRILVKQDAAAILRRTLQPSVIGSTEIVIGTATDCYQPAERRLGITRSVLETLLEWRDLRIGIITKSPLITRDLELLVALAAQHTLRIHISLATTDPIIARKLEPRTPLPHARIRALKKLLAAGLNADLLVAPVVPLLTDSKEALARLMAAARDAGASRVHVVPLRLGDAARRQFLPHLARLFPEFADRYAAHFAAGPNVHRLYADALARRARALRKVYGLSDESLSQRRMGNAAMRRRPEEQLQLLT